MLIEVGVFVFVVEDIIFWFWEIRVANYPGMAHS